MLLWLYGSSLAILVAASIYDQVRDDGFGAELGSTTALFLLFGAFALGHRALVAKPLSSLGFSWRGYLVIAVFSLPILAVVHFYVEAVVGLFKLHLPGEIDHLTGRHWIWPVLLMAILPPVSEELGFRGLIYGGLRRSLSVGETFLVSSFAFAMLHLSIPMLLTHFPLGLYFCWLRHRSGSLWPPIFAHACHNFGVVLLAWTTAL